MRNSTPAIIVVLAMAGTLYVLDSWLPAQIAREHAKITTQRKSVTAVFTKASTSDGKKVPQELLDYIREQRKHSESISDQLGQLAEVAPEIDLSEQLDGSQILDDKFSRFFKTEIAAPSINEFAITPELKEVVQFWARIFGVYGKDHVIFYHPDDVGLVYSVLDFSELGEMGGTADSVRQQMIAEERVRLSRVIRKVDGLVKKPVVQESDLAKSGFSEEEVRLYNLLRDRQGGIDVSAAALVKNLKYRTGFAHRIKKALVQSGRYLPEMQRIFSERGLPTELTMIPFIESTFHVRAYSRSHAAGVWQFIPQTGRRYLRIDEFVDERYDPILATYASASYLAHEYGFLKSWPLTVNAYNTGSGRMMDAVAKLKTTDIATIIKKYDGAGYGFDSRNYYPEFLAMLHVYSNRDEYFSDVEPLPLEEYEYIALPATTNVRNLFHMADVEEEILAQMNPGLNADVLAGSKSLPKGYLLKMPPLLKENILLAAREFYQSRLFVSYHVVKPDEDLASVAKRYNVDQGGLAKLNRILPGDSLRQGDILKLPVEDFDTDVSYVPPKRDLKISEIY